MKTPITLHTMLYQEPRTATLWINPDNSVTLLGSLEHGTQIVVDQELVDALQKIVDLPKIEEKKLTSPF